ncbi:toxin HicA [Prescottella subtropica]|uniref:toxin HicA n=1 Tax=Prescottella subtropica TaxID=2545757 RepID=UPI0010F5B635|nr:toxin HicA [Prescottella subtropica]
MKRVDLLKELRDYARAHGLEYGETEGGNHTKIVLGERRTVVARHTEIPDLLVKKIRKQLEIPAPPAGKKGTT